ncbi:hypothetical protein GK091_25385 [Spirosoma agri]|uniref:Uncharacterized protein n=1 Tax=Spirosoma agri TaxID=1987381 RepID=A0A6M0IPM9_9BACT|nr:hypothetical protein [Spirosoma agri]NEU70236.1 hypothetical protein [Spirosoma agri]
MQVLTHFLNSLLTISLLSQTLSWAQSGTRSSAYNGGMRFTLAHGRDVRQDSTGQVYTLFNLGKKNQQIMKGTPYWAYPTWQHGSIQLKTGMAETPCQIAYNVATNEILCRFNQDTTTYQLEPVAFKIWDAKFVRLTQHGYPTYYQILYQGDAQLFSSYKRQMKLLLPQPYGSAYLIGYFLGLERYYYLKLPNGLFHTFQLTRKSFLQAMGDNVNRSLIPPGETLTVDDVVRVLTDYDAH